VHIKGTVGTTNVDERWYANFAASGYDTHVVMAFGRGGLIDVEIGDGGSGELIFPNDSAALPGAVLCISSAKMIMDANGSSYTFTFNEIGSLGTCPGKPVTGFVDACY
jgi:hypothetical protein